MVILGMDATLLRDLIRQRIHDGRLPRTLLIELGHGHGIGTACDGCGSIIVWNQRMTVRMNADDWRRIRLWRNQMEFEPEFRSDGEIPELHKYHLHPRCFMAWECERQQDGGAHS